MPRVPTPEEMEKLGELKWLPKGATPVIASGTIITESLQDEYKPDPEHYTKILGQLAQLEDDIVESYYDDLNCRF